MRAFHHTPQQPSVVRPLPAPQNSAYGTPAAALAQPPPTWIPPAPSNIARPPPVSVVPLTPSAPSRPAAFFVATTTTSPSTTTSPMTSTSAVMGSFGADGIPIHLSQPVDIMHNYSSSHVGFDEHPQNLTDQGHAATEATELEYDPYEWDISWEPQLQPDELLLDIEKRLEALELAEVDRFRLSGMIPPQYFDSAEEKANSDLLVSREHQYVPIEITDEQLLGTSALALSPYRRMPKDVTIYCYPFGVAEIMDKCLFAMEAMKATGVYIPMMSEVQTEREVAYYAEVDKLRKTRRKDGKKYQIYGIAYDNPNWSLITQIVMKYDMFDGVLLEWVGRDACIWNINQPSRGQIDTILSKAGPLFYFFRMQECQEELILKSPYGAAFVNPNSEVDVDDLEVKPGLFPKFLNPVFPCFQGQEGPCYNAFRYYTEDACSTKQKYAFSPYEPLGNLMMHLANETCHGMPEHDLYSVA